MARRIFISAPRDLQIDLLAIAASMHRQALEDGTRELRELRSLAVECGIERKAEKIVVHTCRSPRICWLDASGKSEKTRGGRNYINIGIGGTGLSWIGNHEDDNRNSPRPLPNLRDEAEIALPVTSPGYPVIGKPIAHAENECPVGICRDRSLQSSNEIAARAVTEMWNSLTRTSNTRAVPFIGAGLSSGSTPQVLVNHIVSIFAESKPGIHDFSRTDFGGRAICQMPRFDMPFELGLSLGAREFSGPQIESLIAYQDSLQRASTDLFGLVSKEWPPRALPFLEPERLFLTDFGTSLRIPMLYLESEAVRTFSPPSMNDGNYFDFLVEGSLGSPVAAGDRHSRISGNRVTFAYDPIDGSSLLMGGSPKVRDWVSAPGSSTFAGARNLSILLMRKAWLLSPRCIGAYPAKISSGNASRYRQLECLIMRLKTEKSRDNDCYRRGFWSFGKRLDALDLRRRGFNGTAPNCLASTGSASPLKTSGRTAPVKRDAKPHLSKTAVPRPHIAFDLRFFHLSKNYVPIALREKPPPLPWASSPNPISPLHVTVRG